MKFVRRQEKKKADDNKEIPKRTKLPSYPKEVKQRAFELFMEVNPGKLMARRYKSSEIARIIQKELKLQYDVSKLTYAHIDYWVNHYGWNRYHEEAVKKAKKLASDVLTCKGAYEYATEGIRANTLTQDRIDKVVAEKAVAAKQVEKLSEVAASLIVDLFMVTHSHRTKLDDVIPGAQGAWRYDCGTSGRRKQLFDMWMEGLNKLMDIYNLTPPKKTTTKAVITGSGGNQEVDIDTTTGSGVNSPLPTPTAQQIVQLFGAQQLKGGFGHDLLGPDNADFPSTAGTEGADEPGKTGSDT